MGTGQMFVAPGSLYALSIYADGNFSGQSWGPTEAAALLANKGSLALLCGTPRFRLGLLMLFNPNRSFPPHEKKYYGVKNHETERKWNITKVS